MPTKTPSEDNKAIGRHAASAFGGKPKVTEFVHDDLPLLVDILQCRDTPHLGITSYATIGLSDSRLALDGKAYPARIELVGACSSEFDMYANILSSVSFHVLRSLQLYMPGSLLLDYVAEYYPNTKVPHLYFTAPFLWDDKLQTLTLAHKQVAWLMTVPISDEEAKYLAKFGDDELEGLLQQYDVEFYNLNRLSCV